MSVGYVRTPRPSLGSVSTCWMRRGHQDQMRARQQASSAPRGWEGGLCPHGSPTPPPPWAREQQKAPGVKRRALPAAYPATKQQRALQRRPVLGGDFVDLITSSGAGMATCPRMRTTKGTARWQRHLWDRGGAGPPGPWAVGDKTSTSSRVTGRDLEGD